MKKLLFLLLVPVFAFGQSPSTVNTTDTPNQGRVKINANDQLLADSITSLRNRAVTATSEPLSGMLPRWSGARVLGASSHVIGTQYIRIVGDQTAPYISLYEATSGDSAGIRMNASTVNLELFGPADITFNGDTLLGKADSAVFSTPYKSYPRTVNLTDTVVNWGTAAYFGSVKDTITQNTAYSFTGVTAGQTLDFIIYSITGEDKTLAVEWPDVVYNAPVLFTSDSVHWVQFKAITATEIVGKLMNTHPVVDTTGNEPDVVPPPATQNLQVLTVNDNSATLSVPSTANDLDTIIVAVDTLYIAEYDAPAATGTTIVNTASVMRGSTSFTNGTNFYIQTPSGYDSLRSRIRLEVDLSPASRTYGTQGYTVEPYNTAGAVDSILVRFGSAIGSGVTLNGEWSVIQDSALSTKWVRLTMASGTATGTAYIGGTVDTTKSWIEGGGPWGYFRYPSSGAGMAYGAYWRFKSGRNDSLQWVAGANFGNDAYAVLQVLTYDSCTVRGKGVVTLTTGNGSGTLTVTSHDSTKSFGIVTGTAATASTGRRMSSAQPTSATQWTITHGTTSGTRNSYAFVVEFTDASAVQRFYNTLAAGSLTGTFSPSGSLTYSTVHHSVNTSAVGDTGATGAIRVALNTSSTITRQSSGAAANVISEVIGWNGLKSVAGGSGGPDTVSWDRAARKVKFWTNADSGQTASVAVGGLTAEKTYYFAAKLQDNSENVGEQSNTVSATTLETPVAASGLTRVWAVDDLTKVMEQDLTHDMATSSANVVWSSGTVNIEGFKGETVAFQLVLQNGASPLYVSAFLDSLKSGSNKIANDSTNPMAFNGREIDVYVVQPFQTIARPSVDSPIGDNWGIEWNQLDNYPPQYYPTRTLDTASFKGYIPKICIPVEVDSFDRGNATGQLGGNPFRVEANRNRIVWVDIFIPRDAVAGTYTGNIRILEGGTLTRLIPVSLVVYNVSMPAGGYLPNSFYYKGHIFSHNGGGALYASGFWTQALKYVQLGHRHGISLQAWDQHQALSSVYNKVSPRADKYTLDKNGMFGMYSGSLFTTTRGYDGPFYNDGHDLIIVGEYGVANVGLNRNPATEARWDTTAFAWGSILTDSSATAGKMLAFGAYDEPLTSDVAKVTDINNIGTYLNNNTSGNKQYARQVSMGAAMSSTWYASISHWFLPYTAFSLWPSTAATSTGSGSYNWSIARARRNAGQYTGVYNFHVAHNTHGWRLDAHPSNLAAFHWGAKKDTVQMYALWTANYFEEAWYTYGSPRGFNYWTDPQYTGLQSGQVTSHFWPGNDTAYSGIYDRDFDGYFVSTQLKAWRRGQQDRVLIELAEDSSLTYTDLYDSLNVGKWLDKWSTTEVSGVPQWQYRTYVDSKGVTRYVPNSPAAHNQNGYVWERVRRVLRGRINAEVNP